MRAVDARARPHYVPHGMNLLLLLSALLSALTGVGSAARSAQPATAVSQAAQVSATRATPVVVLRLTPVAPRLVDVCVAAGRMLTLAPAEPLFAGRRRE